MDSKELDLQLVTKLNSDGLTKHTVYSPEALKALNATPQKTAWGWDDGRPIYNRLPMVSEAYQKSYDKDQASVYLDPTVPIAVGPGTLEAHKNQRNWSELVVEGGTISWEYGELEVEMERIRIDLLNMDRGLVDGEYQVGYRLTHVKQRANQKHAGYELADGVNVSLAKIQLAYDASGDTAEHREPYAISDLNETSWWPNYYYGAEGYKQGTHYTLDFRESTYSHSFSIKGDQGKSTSNLAYYLSDDAIIWYKQEQVLAENDTWEVDAQDVGRYRRFHFWDGTASINNFSYTGQGYFRDNRVLIGDSEAELFIENMYDAIEGNYLLLAAFTVKNRTIHEVRDLRRVTYERYQPVADWVTAFHDEQLRCHFDDVVEYSKLWMNPTTADRQIYYEMDDTNCWGLGEVSVGNEDDAPVIRYPTEVALYGPETDIAPTEVNFVAQPVEPGDLATPPYAQQTLQDWSLDNGKY